MFVASTNPFLVAHQGGWDEALLIAGPIVAIAGLLLLAKRRVDRTAHERADVAGDVAHDQPS